MLVGEHEGAVGHFGVELDDLGLDGVGEREARDEHALGLTEAVDAAGRLELDAVP